MILTASFDSVAGRGGIGLARYRSIVTAADQCGLDAVLFTRGNGSAAPLLDGVPLIAALASVPAEIGLGASIPVEYNEPFHVARAFAAIDRLLRGRSALVADLAAGHDLSAGIGRGEPGADRYERVAEFFEATTKLWDSWEDNAILVDRPAGLFTDPDRIHRVNHDGKYYAVRGPLNAPRPLQGWPVIFMPVTSVESAGLAARVADVALVSGACVMPRGPRAVRVLADVVMIAGRTETDARRKADTMMDYRPEAMRCVGTPARCAARLREWSEAGGHDGFNLVFGAGLADFDLIGECVAALDRRPAVGHTLRDRLDLPRPPSRYAA